MQHNAQFRTPQFKDAKRPAAEHSGGYARYVRRGEMTERECRLGTQAELIAENDRSCSHAR
jgi:hypothetical protein